MAICHSHFSLFVRLLVSRQRDEASDKAHSFKPFLKLFMLVAMCERAAAALGKSRRFPLSNNPVQHPKAILLPAAALKGKDTNKKSVSI